MGERGHRELAEKPNSNRGNERSLRILKRASSGGEHVGNEILSKIPSREYDLIRPHLERVTTRDYQSIHEPGEKLEHTYFPDRGMVCVVAETNDGRTLEVGLATRTGFLGESLAIGLDCCPYRLITQPAIRGFRIRAGALLEVLPQTPELRLRLARYSRFQSIRLSQTAVCNRFHEIEQRLARWLLMSQDRVGFTILPFTHEFLASMLGTGRASLTIAAGTLQKAGIIHYQQGAVKIVSRKKLEQAVCECYGVIRQFELSSQRDVS